MGTIIDLSAPKQKENTYENGFPYDPFDTDIIHLQNFDNFYSLIDRLNQRDASGQNSSRILLVWPSRGKILESSTEFRRLRGWALRNHYEIGLVISSDSVKQNMAKDQGFPVFHSIQEAGNTNWKFIPAFPPVEEQADRARRLVSLKKDIEQSHASKAPAGLRFLAFLCAIAVLIFTLYFILPQAKIEIIPYLSSRSIKMVIRTDENLESPNLTGGIPVTEKRYDFTLSATVPTTGQVVTEPGVAVGSVTIRNTCDRIYYAPSGTVVGTNENTEAGITFFTLEDLTLNPNEEQIVRIEASESGMSGNLAAGSIQYAAYPHSLCWSVRQEQSTTGGTSGIYPAAADEDIITAQNMIDAQIQEASASALAREPESTDLMPIGETTVIAIKKKQMDPEMGFAADTLTLKETIEVSIHTVRKSHMEAIVRGQIGRIGEKNTILTGYEILSGPDEDNGVQTWTIKADYLVDEPETNEEALQIMLRGKTMQQAHSILDTLKHIQSYNIKILPSFLNHIPLASQNIHVIIHPAVETEKP